MKHFHLDGNDLQVFSALTRSTPQQVDFHGGTWKKDFSPASSLSYSCESLRSTVSILLDPQKEHVAAMWALQFPTSRDLYLNTVNVFKPAAYVEHFLDDGPPIKSSKELRESVLPKLNKFVRTLKKMDSIPHRSMLQAMINALIESLLVIGIEWPELKEIQKSPELSSHTIKETGTQGSLH